MATEYLRVYPGERVLRVPHSIISQSQQWGASAPCHAKSLHAKSLWSCPSLATAAHQAPLSMGLCRQESTRVGCCALLQGIFLTQGLSPRLLRLPRCRWILHHLSQQGSV